ncbi:MAG: ABC transporter substrate-binding protein [Proteobacteria bacterium]|nr:ABC transporter substrate-binding protein [Pseudomonadota bacterium]
MPVIGMLMTSSPAEAAAILKAFHAGLRESGFVEGQNVLLDWRWAQGSYDRLPALASELVNRDVTVIYAGGLPAALAAKAATATIPVVFLSGADPVALGLVTSLGRPESNLTGVTQFYGLLGAKRLEVLHEVVPTASTIAILVNPENPNTESHLRDQTTAARALGLTTRVLAAGHDREIESVFASLRERRAEALLISDDPFLQVQRERLAAFATQEKLPTMFFDRQFVDAGGLISYGPSRIDNYRQVAVYLGKILKGAKPADLPVLQPTKFELVINLKTAHTLGLTIPQSILLRADEVVE